MLLLYNALFITILFSFLYFKEKNIYCIVTTAASYNHEFSLFNLIISFNLHVNNCDLIVWNIGLSNPTYKLLLNYSKLNKRMKILNFNYNIYPTYFNINNNFGKYAWKPIIIYETYYKYKKPLIWLDSGCNISGSLDGILSHINKYQIWSERGFHILKIYTHKGMSDYFRVNNSIMKLISCSAATIAFMYPSKLSAKVLEEWKKCSLFLPCISPYGSNLSNHRYDQSAFSIISYVQGVKNLCLRRGKNNVSIHYEYNRNFIKKKNLLINYFK